MSHEISVNANKAETAWLETPWHGLGQQLEEDQPLEVWAREAVLDWTADEFSVFLFDDDDNVHKVPGKKALRRSDTGDVLSVVSAGYQVVQPTDVLEFFRSLIDNEGYRMSVAGNLRDGRRVWALAECMNGLTLPGDDRVEQYLLLATSYDGTMATVVQPTSVRVVCQNTMSMAVGSSGERALLRVPHIAKFNADIIKGKLGLEANEAWDLFSKQAHAMAKKMIKPSDAVQFFTELFYPEGVDIESAAVKRRIGQMINIYETGVGQDTKAANGTVWGLVNAVTRFTDHERRAQSTATRLESAWFGESATLKNTAFTAALDMVA